MLSASSFYEAFAAAGFLTPCVREPKGGGALQEALVRYRRPTIEAFGADGVITGNPSASWAYGTFPGARKGDVLTISPGGQPAVRFAISSITLVSSGQQVRAELQELPPLPQSPSNGLLLNGQPIFLNGQQVALT